MSSAVKFLMSEDSSGITGQTILLTTVLCNQKNEKKVY